VAVIIHIPMHMHAQTRTRKNNKNNINNENIWQVMLLSISCLCSHIIWRETLWMVYIYKNKSHISPQCWFHGAFKTF